MSTPASPVPTIDLARWFTGGSRAREAVAEQVDHALAAQGFLLVTGHQVPSTLRGEVRRRAHEFFAAVTEYLSRMHTLTAELMSICAVALGLAPDHFAAYFTHPTFGFNLNWYPPPRVVGRPEAGQFRIGPHTDFGTVTVLDREPGLGGLQVFIPTESAEVGSAEAGSVSAGSSSSGSAWVGSARVGSARAGTWVDVPHDPAALTVNLGDLMARWTGDRWRSTRHRVLAPSVEAPDEQLLSLIYFGEADHNALVETLPAPIGRTSYPPVVWGEYLHEKLAAISVG